MSWVAVAVAGSAIIGGAISSDSARKAANAQKDATEAAIREQGRQYDVNRTDLAPWREAGTGAIGQLSGMMQPGGDLTRKFTLSDFMSEPVHQASYQSGLERGTQAIDRMGGATGSRNSGAQLKALSRFGTDYTGTKANESYSRFYGDQDRIYNRLAGIAGTGQTATETGVKAGSNTASNISELISAQGNARGAAAIAQGNALSGGISSIGNWYQQQAMLDRMQQRGGYGGGYGNQTTYVEQPSRPPMWNNQGNFDGS